MTKVFLLCAGLGRISRGFESFTQECFDALADAPELDLTLFKGGGASGPKQVVLPNLPRTLPLTLALGKLMRKSGYWIEQVTFTLSLLPHIARQKPDVLFTINSARKWRFWWYACLEIPLILIAQIGAVLLVPVGTLKGAIAFSLLTNAGWLLTHLTVGLYGLLQDQQRLRFDHQKSVLIVR